MAELGSFHNLSIHVVGNGTRYPIDIHVSPATIATSKVKMKAVLELDEDGKDENIEVDVNALRKLSLWQGVALLCADCVGVGVLALPHDISVLGYTLGLTFLILNFPINYYAGDLLNTIALQLESGANASAHFDLALHEEPDSDDDEHHHEKQVELTEESPICPPSIDLERSHTIVHRHSTARPLPGFPHPKLPVSTTKPSSSDSFQDEPISHQNSACAEAEHDDPPVMIPESAQNTKDLIGMTKAIFVCKRVTQWVVLIYYLNLFLVLGNYILVMGRAVSAMFLDQICLPVAGAIASLFMFAVCQLRTMALLGQKVSLASLLAMVVVLIQCLVHDPNKSIATTATTSDPKAPTDIWAKFSSMASIGFAVGSQKLLLNIRYELQDKEEASKVLAGSLTTYGVAYLLVVLLAGSNPPSFLFDTIPEGWSRIVAGLLLWGHVAVSYAINSQALCSSMERFLLSSGRWDQTNERTRWFFLTLAVAISSYLVSNAVPFFKDLVALIGALTSVPLTLFLPTLLYRKFHGLRLLLPHCFKLHNHHDTSWGSYALLLFSFAFFVVGLIGATYSINLDWSNQRRPFACR